MHSFIEIYIFAATIFIHQFVQPASIPQTEEVMAGEGAVITRSKTWPWFDHILFSLDEYILNELIFNIIYIEYLFNNVLFTGGRSSFHIDKRYPEGAPNTVPKLIVMKEKTIEFNCSSYDELTNCQWRGPFSNKPCQNPK